MAPEQDPPKKRVVKKTVVKRAAAGQPPPPVRYGRPNRKPAPTLTKSRPVAKAAPPRKTVTTPRTSRDVGKKASTAASAVAGGFKAAAGKVGSAGGAALGRVRTYRLPVLEQTLASAIVGAFVGAVTVGMAILSSMAFSELRGTSTGGGRWGSLTVVIVAFIAFAVGSVLLAALRVTQPRVKSFLAVCLTLFAILAFFLGLVDGHWAWVVVPLLGAATYALAHRAIAAADSSLDQPE